MASFELDDINTQWGFFGTLKSNFGLSDHDAHRAYLSAVDVFSKIQGDEETARQFLDATFGRHLADALTFLVDDRTGDSVSRREVLSAIKKIPVSEQTKWAVKEYRRFKRVDLPVESVIESLLAD